MNARGWFVALLACSSSSCSEPSRAPLVPAMLDASKPSESADDGGSSGPRACACAEPRGGEAALALTHGPVLGAVTDRSIKVWARGDGDGDFSVYYAPQDEPEQMHCNAPRPFASAPDRSATVTLEELEPDTTYTYRVATMSGDDACGAAATEPLTFRTLPEEGEPARIRVAVGADVRGDNVPGFAAMLAVQPDFVLMIGDNVYADDDSWVEGDFDASFARGQRLYNVVWGGAQFRELFSQVPVFMMWDDHEIMENYWAGKNDLRYEVGRSLFDIYQGSHNPRPLREGELYYAFRAGDISFFVPDLRTHRDGNMDDNDADKSMLGDAQRQAFEQWLTDDDSRVHIIVSSVIMGDFHTTGADPWKSFSTERNALLEVLAEHKTPNTFVISGDQHWSAVLKLTAGELEQYSLYEFQTTPLGSGERAAPMHVDEHVLGLDNKRAVFGVFDVDTREDPPLLDFTMCTVGRPCAPHEEPPPTATDATTTSLPYSVFFEGGDHGFVLQPEP